MLVIRETEQSACHWWEQKSSWEQQLIDANCLMWHYEQIPIHPGPYQFFSYLMLYRQFFFSKDLIDFHQTWWIRQKTRKLLPIWKNNFKWLIYVHIKTLRILIWICFLLFMLHNNCNKCQAGFIIHQHFSRQIIHIPNK